MERYKMFFEDNRLLFDGLKEELRRIKGSIRSISLFNSRGDFMSLYEHPHISVDDSNDNFIEFHSKNMQIRLIRYEYEYAKFHKQMNTFEIELKYGRMRISF